VVRRQRQLVRVAEAISQLLLGFLLGDAHAGVVGQVGAQGLGGEVKAPDEPQQAFGRFVGFAGDLGFAERLEGRGVAGGGELAVADLLDVADHVILDRGEGDGAEEVCRGQLLVRTCHRVFGQCSVPKRVVVASAASRNVDVSTPWSEPIGTLTKDCLRFSNHVLPAGIDAMLELATEFSYLGRVSFVNAA